MSTYLMILAFFGVFFINSRLIDARVDLIISDPEVQVGNDLLILCKAGKEATIQWQKNGEDIEEDDNLVEKIDETSSKIVIKKVTLENGGSYKCICHYDNHDDQASVNIFVYEMPNFGKTVTYHEFLVNQTAHVPCMVSGKPQVDIDWYRNGHVIKSGSGHQNVLPDGTLQIANIQKEDYGTYKCEGRIKGRKILKTLDITIFVNVPPTTIIRREKANVFAGPNTNVTITCLVTGLPTPNITWTTPPTSDSSRYIYNSDKSVLIIPAVVRSDFGKYVCTARNKIGEDNDTFELDVSERPLVTLSQTNMVVQLGGSVHISCNATGHPVPTVSWSRKGNDSAMPSTGRQRVVGSQLVIENVEPSDGGVYSCKGRSEAALTTEDFRLITSPAVPSSFSVSSGPASAHIILNAPVPGGGSPLTKYVLQWRKRSEDNWTEITIPPSDPLEISSLAPYTEYFVRFAVQNDHFLGGFSAEKKIRTQAKHGEPDRPMLSPGESVIEENSFSTPIKQLDDGGSPIKHYVVRYKMDKEGEDWRERQIAANSTRVLLLQLQHGTNYLMEVLAVNVNGFSKPAKLNFSMPQVKSKGGLGKAGVVGIVMVIFLVLLLSVDAFCCYRNRCGLLNFISRKLLVHKMNVSKSVEEGVVNITAVDMNGLDKPRDSIPKLQAQNGPANGVRSEVTCDRAPLTKFEKPPANGEPPAEA